MAILTVLTFQESKGFNMSRLISGVTYIRITYLRAFLDLKNDEKYHYQNSIIPNSDR